MLIAYPKFRQYGFSLIELLVGVVIIGILASVAIPNFQTWIKNSQIRNAAESITNGLQRARAEAVARNTNVSFAFVGTSPSWNVNVVTPNSGIESWSSSEGATQVSVSAVAADVPLTTPPTFNNATPATTITFNNFGGIVNNALVAGVTPPTLARVDLDAPGGNRKLRVTIGVGGNAKMCDPNAPSTSTSACDF